MRKLASVQQITNVLPIPDADKIEICEVNGWQIVCRKGEFKVGDFCCYLEIDSQLPEKFEFEFLRERKFRIKTIKLRGVVSQGICFPMSILSQFQKPLCLYEVGDDVTELLGVTNYKDQEEIKDPGSTTKKNKLLDLLFKFAITRPIGKLIVNLMRVKKEAWPDFIVKTDEERIQNNPRFFDHVSSYYSTEKLDGQSASYFFKKKFFSYLFGVCSRNLWLKTKHACTWWNIAVKYDIENKLKEYGKELYIQGEICGPGIQKNKYNLKEYKLFLFNVYLMGERRFMGYDEMEFFAAYLGCGIVPLIYYDGQKIPVNVQEWVELSKGNSVINKEIPREGIVIRSNDMQFKQSIKVINPEFLLKYKE